MVGETAGDEGGLVDSETPPGSKVL